MIPCERRQHATNVVAVRAGAAPSDDHPIEAAERQRGRGVPELARKDRAPRVQRGELGLERPGRELHAVGLAGQQRGEGARDQIDRARAVDLAGRRVEVVRDLVDGQEAVPPARRDDRQQIGIGDVPEHQHVGRQQDAALEERG